MLVELGLPSFKTVLHNPAASFNRRLGCSTNNLVNYVCRPNCSSYLLYQLRAVFLWFS